MSVPDPAQTKWMPLWDTGSKSGVALSSTGTLAARPAPDVAGNGAVYYATDTLAAYRSDGTAWTLVQPGQMYGSLAARPTPAAAGTGTYYNANDNRSTYISDGSGWNPITQGHNWGSYAGRPAASSVPWGGFYHATDTASLWVSDGSNWSLMYQGDPPVIWHGNWNSSPYNAPYEGMVANVLVSDGVVWKCKYRAGVSSPYKWEVVGGPPLVSSYGPQQSWNQGSGHGWVLLSGSPNVGVPRTGNYVVDFGMRCQVSSNNVLCIQGIFGNGADYGIQCAGRSTGDGGEWSVSRRFGPWALGAGVNLDFRHQQPYVVSTGGDNWTCWVWDRWISLTPINITP